MSSSIIQTPARNAISSDLLDLEAAMSRPVLSKTQTRWERKADSAARAATPSSTSSTTNHYKTPSKSPFSGTNLFKSSTKRGSKTPKSAGRGAGSAAGKYDTAAVTGGQSGQTRGGGDRFIPSRSSMNASISMHNVTNVSANNTENCAPESVNASSQQAHTQEFNSKLAESLFQGDSLDSKILAFKKKAPKPTEGYQSNLRVLYTQNKQTSQVQKKKNTRHIASAPERILDAPDMLNDFYLNLLDWSSTNQLAVALGPCLYVWDAVSGNIELMCELPDEDNNITSVKWMQDGSHIALGTAFNDVQMWNVERKKQVRSMKGHSARVGSLAWNNCILSSGSRDSTIFHHDVRIAQHHIATLRGHEQEICGLSWSPDGTQLASGGNDNMACIWDVNGTEPLHVLRESQAAVKALAWCPFERNLLATGGGTADRHIRFYNSQTGSVLNSIDTKSQVCSLQWSAREKEIVSSHGFSQNQLCVWKYPTMALVGELTGHTSRILHTAVSPDGTTVCSAAADETLRFWKVWEPQAEKKLKSTKRPAASRMNLNIR